MKFLLKQKLRIKREEPFVYLYPNSCSASFVRIAKKLDLIFDTEQKKFKNHLQVERYTILENDYKQIFKLFRGKIEDQRSQFYARPFLEQLILILEYIFKRNHRAKEVRTYSASIKAYDDKQEFLRMALDIAKNITYRNFFYGYQQDLDQAIHKYIYYFQIDDKQVSFHSQIYYSDCPKFSGSWNGYINKSFPFNLTEIKTIQKRLN